MTIFFHEWKMNRRSTITWSLSLAAVIILFMSLFPSISRDADTFKQVLENYPEAVRKAIGVSLNSITSLLGFYAYVFTYVVLCGSIQAINLGLSLLSKESRDKTADFLLTKPVTRGQIITAKLSAALASLMLSNLIFIATAWLSIKVVTDGVFEAKPFLLISLSAFLVECLFLALGLVVSVCVRKIKTVLPLSLGIVFGLFIVNMFGSVIGEKAVRYLTPFQYYSSDYIIKHQSYEVRFIIIEIIIISVAVAISYLLYTKKDIHSV